MVYICSKFVCIYRLTCGRIIELILVQKEKVSSSFILFSNYYICGVRFAFTNNSNNINRLHNSSEYLVFQKLRGGATCFSFISSKYVENIVRKKFFKWDMTPISKEKLIFSSSIICDQAFISAFTLPGN